MAPAKVLLYAEFLPNIRQISVIVALDQPCNPATRGELSADGSQFVLSHMEGKYKLSLPEQAVPSTQLQKLMLGSKELSWRLPVVGASSRSSSESVQGNDAPWSGGNLSPASEFFCRKCGTIIVPKGVIKSWRDLPSENWAEMMDFWHCHKPDIETDCETAHSGHNHGENSNANRGYGANTKFVAQPGIGFVHLTGFLLNDSDCQNLKTTAQGGPQASSTAISCTSCQAAVGYIDLQACGIRLHKWRLSSSSLLPSLSGLLSPASLPSVSVILSSKLLSILRAQCSSKAVLIPESSSSSGNVHLWVLQQALFYSTSGSRTSRIFSSPTASRTLAMKVLWKNISKKDTELLLDNGKAEDVVLPADAVTEIENCLRDSAQILPAGARMFQGWNVGLWERYQVGQ